jgi:hypothetical protein
LTGNKKRSGKELFNDDKYDSNQKHNHGYLIDPMHHSQVKISGAAGVILSEKITKHFTQAEILFNLTHAMFIYSSGIPASCTDNNVQRVKVRIFAGIYLNILQPDR